MMTVNEDEAGIRLDRFLSGVYPETSRSALQKRIADGMVLVNGGIVKDSYKIRAGDVIDVMPAGEPEMPSIEPENIPLDILYEDQDVIVVNKPKGMVVHPCPGHWSGTLVNALMWHCQGSLSGINGVLRPGIVHRIDMNTTGSLAACKNDESHNSLAKQLSEHSIDRRYRAIVHGGFRDDEGTVRSLIGRSPKDRKKMAVVSQGGKEAVTHYRVLERFGDFTYIECILETGRTHQIRVHMSSIGHPLLGDDVYGSVRKEFAYLQGQTLHAMVLGFTHPRTGERMVFSAPLPAYFEELLEKFRTGRNR